MVRYVAFIRGINVGKHKPIAMNDLVALLADMGYADTRSYLRSGNVIFTAADQPAVDLESILESQTAERLALRTDYFVRSRDDLTAIVAGNPFPDEAVSDPSHLIVQFTKTSMASDRVDALQAAIKGREIVRIGEGRDLYIYYPDGIGESQLTAPIIDRHLGTITTGRNWNTVVRLYEMMTAESDKS